MFVVLANVNCLAGSSRAARHAATVATATDGNIVTVATYEFCRPDVVCGRATTSITF